MFRLKRNKINHSILSDPYIDSNGDIWEAQYRYDGVEIQLVNCNIKELELNQSVVFDCDARKNTKDISSIKVFSSCKESLIGFIVSGIQRDMIYNYTTRDERMVKGQISAKTRNKVCLRIFYYQSRKYIEKQRAIYEAEKSAYKRLPSITFVVELIGNKSEKMQWEISHACIGDKVEIWEEENKYIVETHDSYDLGYLPQSVSKKVSELEGDGYEPNGEIAEITNDNGKYIVRIRLTLEDKNYL